MRFRLLGPLEVVGASGPLVLGGPKQRSVLAILALSANRVVPTERLIAGVWGEEANEKAGATLQVYVSNLRRILRSVPADTSATIDGRRPGYVLTVSPEDVDVVEFARLVAEARDDIRADRTARGAAAFHRALALWRGDAIADLVGEAFFESAATRLEQGRMAALEERIEADLVLGRHRELLADLERLVAEHPLRERLWCQFIVALYRADRQADALAAYGRARSLLADELGIDPGPALRELERAVLQQDLPVEVPVTPTPVLTAPVHLPSPIGRTIGRDVEVAGLVELLAGDDTRLVTLTGPGGSGKTRLLLKVAEELVHDFPGGVHFVDLTALTTPAQVMPAITQALVGDAAGEAPLATATEALADRDTLLLLDNFEHVLAAAPDVADLLRGAPRLRVLTSSQIPLRITEEVEHRVHGLDTPAIGADTVAIGESAAVQLFLARARRIRSTLTLESHNAELMAQICRRLDGLPLAIELAAARTRALSLESLLGRLDDSLTLLTAGGRDAPTRQRTLRAAVEWSVGLLDATPRAVLAHLGVFAGQFDLAAALAVCGADSEEGLTTLLENSLVQSEDVQGEPYFRVVDSVRQYAREALASPEGSAGDLRHLVDHYVTAAETARSELDGPRATGAAAAVDSQQANFRLALDGALRAGDHPAAARLAVALAPLWLVLGRATEARQNLAAVTAAGGSPDHDAELELAGGRLAYQQNDLDVARDLLTRSLGPRKRGSGLSSGDAALAQCLLAAVSASFGEPDALAAAETALAAAEADGGYPARVVGRSILAIACARTGDFAREKQLYQQRLQLARVQDDRVRIADTLTVLGEIAFDDEDYVTATELVREAFDLADGHSRPESRDALIMLGRIAVADHDPERAVGFLNEALQRSIDVGQPAALALCLRAHAAAATIQGDALRGARLFGAGDTLQPALVPVNPQVERDLATRRDECRNLLGVTVFEREYSAGTALDVPRASALATGPAVPRIAV